MQKRIGFIAAGALTVGVVGGATGIAAATGNGPVGRDDPPAISGSAYDRATSAAQAATSPGNVTQTEQGNDESYYQVEVTHPDGSVTDVNLDRSFVVVKTKTDAPENATDPNEKAGNGDKADAPNSSPDGETRDGNTTN